MIRLNRFDRIFALHRILASCRTALSLAGNAEKLECSQSTGKRVVKALRDHLNAPLLYDREQNDYYLPRENNNSVRFDLPEFWLNPSEFYALLVCHPLLAKVRPGLLEDHIEPLRSWIDLLL